MEEKMKWTQKLSISLMIVGLVIFGLSEIFIFLRTDSPKNLTAQKQLTVQKQLNRKQQRIQEENEKKIEAAILEKLREMARFESQIQHFKKEANTKKNRLKKLTLLMQEIDQSISEESASYELLKKSFLKFRKEYRSSEKNILVQNPSSHITSDQYILQTLNELPKIIESQNSTKISA